MCICLNIIEYRKKFLKEKDEQRGALSSFKSGRVLAAAASSRWVAFPLPPPTTNFNLKLIEGAPTGHFDFLQEFYFLQKYHFLWKLFFLQKFYFLQKFDKGLKFRYGSYNAVPVYFILLVATKSRFQMSAATWAFARAMIAAICMSTMILSI